ncbi:tudor domain-containing protein 10 [Spea bombifrons]|uniref:tudor domain-containing protein 10 n=1 Tax=Spea bombifrons TaxID=233779 RepID=UPI00234A00AA|nr:tudor domain-containing protein 10 [Spea bombifrons]
MAIFHYLDLSFPPTAYFGKCLSPLVPCFKEAIYTMPMEMRGGFLCCVLRDCTKDLTWLPAIMNMSGEVSLLVTNVFPNSPYFWAVLVQEDVYASMTNLFIALSKVVDHLPCLSKREVHRGLRCLAQCMLLYGEDMTWNRCWVVDVVGNHAIVFMLDYGITATVPIQCLRPLDSDTFWMTPPLAQPFFSRDGFKCIDFPGTFVDGEISGSCLNERHVLMFTKHAHKE